MIKVKNCAAQGDLLIRRVEVVPEGYTAVPAEEGRHVLAHSETGHHHAMEALGVVCYRSENPLVSFLEVTGEPSILQHQRDWDTHDSLEIGVGIYEIRRQREFTPEGWRRVED